MHKPVTAFVLLGVLISTSIAASQDGFLRSLQSTVQKDTQSQTGESSGERKPPSYVGKNVTIPFQPTLGCGACISAGYIFCIPGQFGSNSSSWGTNKPVCCQNSTACTQAKSTSYNCSSQFENMNQAKRMCPFNKTQCGGKQGFNFSDVGQSQTLNITLAQGESCTFQVQAKCGLPKFKPNQTTGFQITVLDYDDRDMKNSNSSSGGRLLQSSSSDERSNQTNSTKNSTQGKGDDDKEDDDFSSDKLPPPLPGNFTPVNSQSSKSYNKSKSNYKDDDDEDDRPVTGGRTGQAVVGPQQATYLPDKDTDGYAYKGGKQNGADDTLCVNRYQQISVTAIGNLSETATAPARILQTTVGGTTYYTMQLTVSTSDFSGAFASLAGSFAALLIAGTTVLLF